MASVMRTANISITTGQTPSSGGEVHDMWLKAPEEI